MSKINFLEEKQSADFQIVLLDKQYCPITKKLVPTGKKVVYSSDNGSDIASFYYKHEQDMKARGGKKRNRRNRKKNKGNK